MIQYTIDYNKEQFTKDYKSLVEEFKSKFYFIEIDCKKEKIKWPQKSGVNVIWKRVNNLPNKEFVILLLKILILLLNRIYQNTVNY